MWMGGCKHPSKWFHHLYFSFLNIPPEYVMGFHSPHNKICTVCHSLYVFWIVTLTLCDSTKWFWTYNRRVARLSYQFTWIVLVSILWISYYLWPIQLVFSDSPTSLWTKSRESLTFTGLHLRSSYNWFNSDFCFRPICVKHNWLWLDDPLLWFPYLNFKAFFNFFDHLSLFDAWWSETPIFQYQVWFRPLVH